MNALAKTTNNERQPAPEPRTFIELLESHTWREKMASKLPSTMTIDRLKGVVLTAFNRQPKLMVCTPISVYQALTECATYDLWPGAQGHAYLVPYGNKRKGADGKDVLVNGKPVWEDCCQFQLGYRGMVDLAYRSGHIEPGSFQVSPVYAGDEFDMAYGSESFIKHRPKILGDRGECVGFYAVCRPKGSRPVFDVMRKDEVDAIRGRSKSGTSGPWVTDYNAMGCKTVLRRFWKMLPSSVTKDFADLLEREADMEFGTLEEKARRREKVDTLTGQVREKQPAWSEEQTRALGLLSGRLVNNQAHSDAFQARWRKLKYSDPEAALEDLTKLVDELEAGEPIVVETADGGAVDAPAPATIEQIRELFQKVKTQIGQANATEAMDRLLDSFSVHALADLHPSMFAEFYENLAAIGDEGVVEP
jgi:recombination protein RecT